MPFLSIIHCKNDYNYGYEILCGHKEIFYFILFVLISSFCPFTCLFKWFLYDNCSVAVTSHFYKSKGNSNKIIHTMDMLLLG